MPARGQVSPHQDINLFTVESHSKELEVIPVRSITATILTDSVRHVFSTHRLLEIIVANNGTQFQGICQSHSITHLYSPPYHPQSDDHAERFVDSLKRAPQKSYEKRRQKRPSIHSF